MTTSATSRSEGNKMARKTQDPFGFMAAINWDAVEEHADEIVAIFEKDEEH